MCTITNLKKVLKNTHLSKIAFTHNHFDAQSSFGHNFEDSPKGKLSPIK